MDFNKESYAGNFKYIVLTNNFESFNKIMIQESANGRRLLLEGFIEDYLTDKTIKAKDVNVLLVWLYSLKEKNNLNTKNSFSLLENTLCYFFDSIFDELTITNENIEELNEIFSDDKTKKLLDEFFLSKNQVNYDVFSSPEKFSWFSKNLNYIKLDELLNCIENQYKEYIKYDMTLKDLYFEINNFILDMVEFIINNYFSEFCMLNENHDLLTNLINHGQKINDPDVNMIIRLKFHYESELIKQEVNTNKTSKRKVL